MFECLLTPRLVVLLIVSSVYQTVAATTAGQHFIANTGRHSNEFARAPTQIVGSHKSYLDKYNEVALSTALNSVTSTSSSSTINGARPSSDVGGNHDRRAQNSPLAAGRSQLQRPGVRIDTPHSSLNAQQAQQQTDIRRQTAPLSVVASSLPGASGTRLAQPLARQRRFLHNQDVSQDCENAVSPRPTVYALRCDDAHTSPEGAIIIRAYESTRLFLIGRNFWSNLTVAVTEQDGAAHDDCTHADRIKSWRIFNMSSNIAEIYIDLPPPDKRAAYYLCLREDREDARWYHQGSEPWLQIYVEKDFMPTYMKILTVACLLSLSGLFSGLNLGLMALDKNELQVIMKCGTEEEKRYASVIEPVRRRGNYLLCSILFSNTLVNSTISVFLEDLSDGVIAVITSTILIVMFGEILPQAFCSRHGLAVGAKTIWMTRFCMFITSPMSWLVSTALDWALGEEIGHAYDRERLMEFIRVTRDINNLEPDEFNIIAGALKIKRVQIGEVMTRIEDVFMLDEKSVLDFNTIREIVDKGYSRIPIHESGNRKHIKAVLFAKDLALVDPDQDMLVQTLSNFHGHPTMFVYEDTTLDKALNEFKTGKAHMAIVQKVIDDGDKDPYLEVTGIVTLEDVIEEIIQMEINDETDTLTDNRRKRRRKDAQVRKDFSQFMELGAGESSFKIVTPQLCLATYQFLSTSVEPFTSRYISDSILKRLLTQKIFYKVKLDDDDDDYDDDTVMNKRRLYTSGEPADYFIMILEGRVQVTCGAEMLIFDGGPFSYFGKAALTGCDESEINAPGSAINVSTIATGGAQLQSTPVASRRDSSKPLLSRRESVAKIITSLSIARKSEVPSPSIAPNALEMTPTAMVSHMPDTVETIQLPERARYYFKPDYTVDIIANTSYMKVTRNDYLTALRATWLERGTNRGSGDEADYEIPALETSPSLSNSRRAS